MAETHGTENGREVDADTIETVARESKADDTAPETVRVDGDDALRDDAAGDPSPEEETSPDTPADERLIAILESVLFAAGEPLTLVRLADVIPGPSRSELRAALTELGARGEREQRGIRVIEVAGGYQYRTAPAQAEWVRRLFQQKPWRLTRATLETLAIVAYKQPITRAEIEVIRGVDVDSVLASLLTRKLIKIIGRKEVIGRPLLYGTTRQFLEVFGLKDLASLPALTEVAASMPDGVEAGAAGGSDETWSGDDGENESGNTIAEAAGGSGDLLPSGGGDDDQQGARQAERENGDRARDASEADRQDPRRR